MGIRTLIAQFRLRAKADYWKIHNLSNKEQALFLQKKMLATPRYFTWRRVTLHTIIWGTIAYFYIPYERRTFMQKLRVREAAQKKEFEKVQEANLFGKDGTGDDDENSAPVLVNVMDALRRPLQLRDLHNKSYMVVFRGAVHRLAEVQSLLKVMIDRYQDVSFVYLLHLDDNEYLSDSLTRQVSKLVKPFTVVAAIAERDAESRFDHIAQDHIYIVNRDGKLLSQIKVPTDFTENQILSQMRQVINKDIERSFLSKVDFA